MKSLLLISACAVAAVSTMAQGTINFLNRDTANGINAPITDVDGTTKLQGTDFSAMLYAGPTGGSLAAVGAAQPFDTGNRAGYWSNKESTRTIPTVTPGNPADVQVYVWESKYADLAAAQAAGGKWGMSTKFTVPKTGGSGVPPEVPQPMLGITSFSLQQTVIPEPTTIALGLLGAGAMMFRRRK